jgi:hypothetical protein
MVDTKTYFDTYMKYIKKKKLLKMPNTKGKELGHELEKVGEVDSEDEESSEEEAPAPSYL